MTPYASQFCSAEQRRRTPPAFARWLVDLAATAAVQPSHQAEGS